MEKYKDFLSSTVAFLYLSVDICPRHPSTQKGRIWRLTANQLHGTFTPGVVLTRMPSLAATDRGNFRVGARPVTGHESHYPCRPSSPQRELPVVFKLLFLARFLSEGLGAGLARLGTAGSCKMRDLFSCS